MPFPSPGACAAAAARDRQEPSQTGLGASARGIDARGKGVFRSLGVRYAPCPGVGAVRQAEVA